MSLRVRPLPAGFIAPYLPSGSKSPGNDLTKHFFSIVEAVARLRARKRRKATLNAMLSRAVRGIQFNEHTEGDGPILFNHACKLGL
jgi:hypothetical protein